MWKSLKFQKIPKFGIILNQCQHTAHVKIEFWWTDYKNVHKRFKNTNSYVIGDRTIDDTTLVITSN